MRFIVENELKENRSVIASMDMERIAGISEILVKTFRADGKLLIFGNGGSASDASHLAGEFSGRYRSDRAPLPVIALNDVTSMSAIANDYSFDEVFERQVRALVENGDAVIGISTSGESENVLRAVGRARELGAVTICLTGNSGRLSEVVEYPFTVPSDSTPRIQEGYMVAGHTVCGLVERRLFGKKVVFIDRDDTVARDVPYCSRPEDLELFEGVGRSIRKLNGEGFLVIMVTNQSGIARGFFSEEMLQRIHGKMVEDLSREGGSLDAIYHCPHHPDDGCDCRKPGTGMILQADRDFLIDYSRSFFIGDSPRDIELAEIMGIQAIRVREGTDFNDAVDSILSKNKEADPSPD